MNEEKEADTFKHKAIEIYNSALMLQWAEKPNYEEAARLYRLSANLGFAGAQNNLGDCYEHGIGLEKNYAMAVYWYTRAAERGHLTARREWMLRVLSPSGLRTMP